jgi:hypothetical protein
MGERFQLAPRRYTKRFRKQRRLGLEVAVDGAGGHAGAVRHGADGGRRIPTRGQLVDRGGQDRVAGRGLAGLSSLGRAVRHCTKK